MTFNTTRITVLLYMYMLLIHSVLTTFKKVYDVVLSYVALLVLALNL